MVNWSAAFFATCIVAVTCSSSERLDGKGVRMKCVLEPTDGLIEIAFDGLFQAVLDLVGSWRLREILVFLVGAEEGWDVDLVRQVFRSNQVLLTLIRLENPDDVIDSLSEIERHNNFVVCGSNGRVARLMQVVLRRKLIRWNHVWILGLRRPLNPTDVLDVGLWDDGFRTPQFVVLLPAKQSRVACGAVRLFDVFRVDDTFKAVQFGDWTHRRGLFIWEELTVDQMKSRLQRRLVRGVGFEFPPFSIIGRNVDGTLNFHGYITDTLYSLAQHFNFKFEMAASKGKTVGTVENGTFTGIIGAMSKREADITSNILAITPSRYDSLRFTFPVMQGVMSLWFRSRGKTVSPVAHVLAFSPLVWTLTVSATVVLLTSLTISVVRSSRFPDRLQVLKWILSGEFLESIFTETDGLASKAFLATFLIFSLLVSTYYNSVFMAFLAVSKSSVPFSNVEELLQLKSFHLSTVGQASYHDIFRTSESGVFHAIWQRMSSEHLYGDTEEGLAALCDAPDLVFIIDLSSPMYIAERQKCLFSWIATNYLKGYGHIGVRNEFPYNRIISRTVLRMREFGILSRIMQQYQRSDFLRLDSEGGEQLSLELSHFSIPFYVLAAGTGSSLFVFVLEIVFVRMMRL